MPRCDLCGRRCTYCVYGSAVPGGPVEKLISGVTRKRAEAYAARQTRGTRGPRTSCLVETDCGRWVSRWYAGKRERKWR